MGNLCRKSASRQHAAHVAPQPEGADRVDASEEVPLRMAASASEGIVTQQPRVADAAKAATTGTECEGSDREHVMLSGRFNKPEIIKYIKDVKRGLDEKGVKTYMVECSEGEDFSEATMEGLDGAWAMVVFGTSEYGAKTGAGYETYEELRYAHQKKLPLFSIQLCDRWPPAPKDSDGGKKGKAQNGFVLRDTVIRLSDPEMKKPQEIAEKLAKILLSTEEGRGHEGLKADEKSQEAGGHGGLKADEKSQADQNAKDEEAAANYEDSDANPAIRQAAKAGDVAAVRHFIRADSGAVHRVDRFGSTAMHFAAWNGHAEVLSILAAAGADVEKANINGYRPLHRAAFRGHAAAVAKLLQLGATVAPKNDNGNAPLHDAARHGHVAVVNLLVEAGAALDSENDKGETPLSLAKQEGNTDVVKVLEGSGHASVKADEKSQEGSGHASLKADEKSQEDFVILLDKTSGEALGIDVDHEDGRTLKVDAINSGLVQKWNKENPDEAVRPNDRIVEVNGLRGHAQQLLDECRKSKMLTIRVQMAAQLPMEAAKYEDSCESPAICRAAGAGDIAAVRHLIRADSGVVYWTAENGWTAIHFAALNGHVEVLSALAAAGGDVEKVTRDHGRETPLHFATMEGHAAAVALLLQLGAAEAPKSNSGETPLHWAAFNGRVEVATAKLLVAAGAPLDSQSNDGETPLHWAARLGRVEVAKLLVAARAALDSQSNDGRTPLDVAKQHRKTAVVRLLEEAQGRQRH